MRCATRAGNVANVCIADYPAAVNEPPVLFGAIEGGGTKFICAVGSPDAPPLQLGSIPTADPATTLAACLAFFEDARRFHGPIAALGVACFGPLQLRRDAPDYGCLLDTPKPGWSGASLLAPLQAALRVPVALDTDVGAAALAEWRLGAGRGLGSLVYVTVGTGIGGTLVPRSTGTHLMHAEMGHVPLRRDPRDTGFAGHCPFHGDCAEGLASGPAIRARWGCELSSLPPDHPGRDIIAGYLGQLAAAIVLMHSPQCIVMGGGVMGDELLLPLVRRAMHDYLGGYLPPLRGPAAFDAYLRAPELGAHSGIRVRCCWHARPARSAAESYCSPSTFTDFGSSVTRSRPSCTVAVSGFGTTTRGASKEFMLSTCGPVSASPVAERTVAPRRSTSICTGRVGSTLVSDSHSLPALSFAATASTRGSEIAALRPGACIHGERHEGGVLERHVHAEHMVGGGQQHLLLVGEDHGLQHVDHLRDVGHAHAVRMPREDVQVQRREDRIAQAVLLLQETGVGARRRRIPARPTHPPPAAVSSPGSYLSMIAVWLAISPSIFSVVCRISAYSRSRRSPWPRASCPS